MPRSAAQRRLRIVTASSAITTLVIAAAAGSLSADATTGPVKAGPVAAKPPPVPALPLGQAGLPQRTVARTISPGVGITTIVRGNAPGGRAASANGPWAVRLVVIDPARTRAKLRTTIGDDLARTDQVTELARRTSSIVSLNGSFFSLNRSKAAPGDPVGFAMVGGQVISKQTGTAAEANVIIDSSGNRLRFGAYSWSATASNSRSGDRIRIDDINTIPAAASRCDDDDERDCDDDGQVVRFTPHFAASTPRGAGTEVVLDRRGCVDRVLSRRGTALASWQTSLQATGAAAGELKALAGRGACLKISERVTDEKGRKVTFGRHSYAVAGRHRLLVNGTVASGLNGANISKRNPRSVIGTLPGGKIGMLNIDGRSARSVGATLTETARVAKALGFRDAVNLDGGGSTVLVAGTTVLSTLSGSRMRPVSDAIVLVP